MPFNMAALLPQGGKNLREDGEKFHVSGRDKGNEGVKLETQGRKSFTAFFTSLQRRL